MWRDEVDRLVRDDYLGDLSSRSLEDVRALRDECRDTEDKVSYLRRLIQGRLDIVAADLRRRAAGGSPGDLGALVEQLPDVDVHAPAIAGARLGQRRGVERDDGQATHDGRTIPSDRELPDQPVGAAQPPSNRPGSASPLA